MGFESMKKADKLICEFTCETKYKLHTWRPGKACRMQPADELSTACSNIQSEIYAEIILIPRSDSFVSAVLNLHA
jgi:hypothetical protein